MEVKDGRKGDVDGEGERGDEEKVYCSGSTAGRDHGFFFHFFSFYVFASISDKNCLL